MDNNNIEKPVYLVCDNIDILTNINIRITNKFKNIWNNKANEYGIIEKIEKEGKIFYYLVIDPEFYNEFTIEELTNYGTTKL